MNVQIWYHTQLRYWSFIHNSTNDQDTYTTFNIFRFVKVPDSKIVQ